MPTVTATTVWQKMLEDPTFSQENPDYQIVLRPFIAQLPTILTEWLNQPATLGNIMGAKILFLVNCISNGFAESLVATIPDDAEVLRSFSRQELSLKVEATTYQLIKAAVLLISELQSLREGTSDEAVLAIEKEQILSGMNLNAATRSLYLAGWPTIGDLLITQPRLIANTTQ